MSAPLAEYAPFDIETFLVAYMTPLRRSGFERKAGDSLPFTLVNHIAGSESVEESSATALVSVHTFCDKAAGAVAARDECAKTHQRMLRLATHRDTVTVSGRVLAVEYVEVVESPRWEYYSDNVLRKCGRYRIGYSYIPVT